MCFCKRRVTVEYKEKIIKMVNEIDCEDYIMKIYFYVLARYKKYKEKKSEERECETFSVNNVLEGLLW